MKKIIFKIAFSRKVGSGHLYRSSNLAQLLKDRGVETILILEKKNKVPKKLKLKRAFDKVLFINSLKNIPLPYKLSLISLRSITVIILLLLLILLLDLV